MILRFDKIGAVVIINNEEYVLNRNAVITRNIDLTQVDVSSYLYKLIVTVFDKPTMFVFSHYNDVLPNAPSNVISRMLLDAIENITATTELYYTSENVRRCVHDLMYDHEFMTDLFDNLKGYPPYLYNNIPVSWDVHNDDAIPINENEMLPVHISGALHDFCQSVCGAITTSIAYQYANVAIPDIQYFPKIPSVFQEVYFLVNCFEPLPDILYVVKTYDDILTLVYRDAHSEMVTGSWSAISSIARAGEL